MVAPWISAAAAAAVSLFAAASTTPPPASTPRISSRATTTGLSPLAWPHLPYDAPNFLCVNYASVCNAVLDQFDCPSAARGVFGCADPTNANVPATLDRYAPECSCGAPYVPSDTTASRVGELLFDNRIKADVGWNLAPCTGPPFDPVASYAAVCYLALDRLGCPPGVAYVNTSAVVTDWTCACGAYDLGSTRAYENMVDSLADLTLQSLPVFADPLTLSYELSIAVMLVAGKLGSLIANALYLPPIIGFLVAGISIQDVVAAGLVKGCSTLGAKFFSGTRAFALIVVLSEWGWAGSAITCLSLLFIQVMPTSPARVFSASGDHAEGLSPVTFCPRGGLHSCFRVCRVS